MNSILIDVFTQLEKKDEKAYEMRGKSTALGKAFSGTWLSKDKKSVTNYPGQHHCANDLAKFFPKEFKVYAEPLCGKARTAKYAQDVCGQENMILFDLNAWALEYCKTTFPKAHVHKIDFRESLELLRKMENAFVFIDPPWYSFPAYVMTNTIGEYFDQVLEILGKPYACGLVSRKIEF